MQHVFGWHDLITEARKQFPAIDQDLLFFAKDDIGALVREISRAHDLTLSEAADMVVWRLPSYVPADYQVRLSA